MIRRSGLEILPNIFITNHLTARDPVVIKELKATHILTIALEYELSLPPGLNYKRIPAEDTVSFPLNQYFDEIADFINESYANGGSIIVHCGQGISRSPSAVIAFLIKYKKMTFVEAHELVKSRRSIISLNPGFVKQLKEYEEQTGISEDAPDDGMNKMDKISDFKKKLNELERVFLEKNEDIFIKIDKDQADQRPNSGCFKCLLI